MIVVEQVASLVARLLLPKRFHVACGRPQGSSNLDFLAVQRQKIYGFNYEITLSVRATIYGDGVCLFLEV